MICNNIHEISATVPRGTQWCVHRVSNGSVGRGLWDCLRAPPPITMPSCAVPEFLAYTFFDDFFDIDFLTSQRPLWDRFVRLFRPQGAQNDRKATQNGTNWSHFRSFGRYGWKCENDVFVYTKPSVSWFEGVPGTSCAARFGHRNGDRRTDRLPDTPKRRKCRPGGAQGRPRVHKRGSGGGVRELPFSSFFRLGSLGRSPGAPKVAKVRPRAPK